MASGHMNRVKRPDTWLHRPMLQNVKKVLANPEPSTHGPRAYTASSSAVPKGGVSSAPDPPSRRATVKMSDPSAPSERKRSTETTASTPLKFSVLRLAFAFVIA